ncbi:hypothetical protein L1987_18658 [Smallanthus sonchifolius]|uniref:Uncharacterized protein n=1 Tax=Smallanthus sonchifolius TaxID=185202 RepID=A0ACB9J0D3_9ASTR|nr:hypothetical protein L1987_18658 [Smallanthus sonchifolius]
MTPLSTVVALAYCLSSAIQQTRNFFMETSDATDTRNFLVLGLFCSRLLVVSVMIHATRPLIANEWIKAKIEGYEVSRTVEVILVEHSSGGALCFLCIGAFSTKYFKGRFQRRYIYVVLWYLMDKSPLMCLLKR